MNFTYMGSKEKYDKLQVMSFTNFLQMNIFYL